MEIVIIALLVLLILTVGAAVFFLRRSGDGKEMQLIRGQYDSLRAEFHNSLSSNLKLVTSQLSNVTSQLNEQLSSVTMQLNSSTGQINERMDNAARMVGEVRHHLGELSKATGQIYEIGKDISGLENLLKAPKLRGGFGEFLLADLLSQCLPSAHFELQYGFPDGSRCDAVIRLKGGLVPIDSKFPLENFKRIFDSPTEEAKSAARRRFAADCKKHIDAIASSYILPEQGTLNFALMYIPAENVYYEMIIKDEDISDERLITGYAFSKRVIPVSPNSLFTYLQTIIMGLKGMEISDRARLMLSHMDGLRNEFGRFMGEVDILGKHINNTRTKYEEVQRKAVRFVERLEGAGAGTPFAGEEPGDSLKGR